MTVNSLLNKLKIKGELRIYVKDSYDYIKKNKICYLDINLTKDIYPYLGEKYELSETSVKTRFIRMLQEFNQCEPNPIKEYFGVKSKITIKRLLTLISIELK